MNDDKTYFSLYNQIIEFIKNNYEFDAVKLNHDFNTNHESYIHLCNTQQLFSNGCNYLECNKWYIVILSRKIFYIESSLDYGKKYIFTNFSDIKNILVKTFRDSKVLTKDETLIKDIIE